MNDLDPRTLIAIGGFMALVLGVVLGFMRRYYPPSIHGLGHWALAPAAMLGGTIFFAAPGPWPLELGRWLGNALLLLGFMLFHFGCRRFFGHATQRRPILAIYGLVLLALAWFAYVDPSYRARVVVVTVAIAALHVVTLLFLLRRSNKNFPIRMVQFTLALHLAVLLVRLQTALTMRNVGDLMDASLVQTVYIGAYVIAVLMLLIGAVLMATDRVRTELEHVATHDGLTGALNRGAILALSEDEHERSVRYGQPFSLMMIDLDHFKAVNDNFGHQHGDKVLVHFAERARAALRRADRFGRYGGEEFLVLLPNTATDAALPVAQRIHTALATGHALDCQVSIGVTHWRGPDDTLDTMLGRADAALYQAKGQGRNQTCTA